MRRAVSAALLLIPLALQLVRRVMNERLVPRAYVWALLALAAIQPVGGAAAGTSLTESQLALQRFGMQLSRRLWGTA